MFFFRFFRKPTSFSISFESPTVFPFSLKVFRKPTSPPLPLREGPPLSPSPFPLRGQGMCQPPYSVLKPLRYKVGGPSEVFASSGAAFCGMQPHGHKSLTSCRKAMKTIAARQKGACYFCELLGLQGVLLIWASWPSGRVAYLGCKGGFSRPIPVVRVYSEQQE